MQEARNWPAARPRTPTLIRAELSLPQWHGSPRHGYGAALEVECRWNNAWFGYANGTNLWGEIARLDQDLHDSKNPGGATSPLDHSIRVQDVDQPSRRQGEFSRGPLSSLESWCLETRDHSLAASKVGSGEFGGGGEQ